MTGQLKIASETPMQWRQAVHIGSSYLDESSSQAAAEIPAIHFDLNWALPSGLFIGRR
jgi:hypothetical protein